MTQSTLPFDGPLANLYLQAFSYSPKHFTLDETRDLFDLNPPYQRASVWDDDRRRLLVRSLLLGIPVGAIILNKASDTVAMDVRPYTVIDGKQRIEALRAFVDDELAIPLSWVDDEHILRSAPVDGWPVPGVRWSDLDIVFQRRFYMRSFAVVEATGKTLQEQAEIFRLINAGGVDQTAEDLARAAAIEQR